MKLPIWQLVLISCWISTRAISATLAVPNVPQRPQTNWCWAASSQAVLAYTGSSPGMCSIADWARQQNGWGTDNCCTNGTGEICNRVNSLWGDPGSVENILSHWGAGSKRYSRSLTLTEVQEAIDDSGPIVIAWLWTAGGGHAVVLHGYNGSNVTIMDPWNGPTIMTHSNAQSQTDRTWATSLKVVPKKVTYVVDDTGSMGNEIASVKSTIQSQINGYKSAGQFVKYALITYKDNVTFRGSTVNSSEISAWVGGLFASGGGDCPEEGYGALDMAAEKAPNSDVWWMTDADSHGNFLRMLATRARLLLAGNTLHSVILGSCSVPFPSASVAGTSGIVATDDGQTQRSFPVFATETFAGALAATSVPSSFEAGRILSESTGGLFFAVHSADVDEATAIILNQVGSTALLRRLNMPPGQQTNIVPVDTSITSLYFIIDLPAGAIGSMTVRHPDGALVVPGAPGVTEVVAGSSRLLRLTGAAVIPGSYAVQTSANQGYVFNVSALSNHALELVGDSSAGVGGVFPVRVSIPTLSRPVGFTGPGPAGPGGPLSPSFPTPTNLPFRPSELRFFVVNDSGSSRTPIALYDDGSHDDGEPQDGVFGGQISIALGGAYRIGCTDLANFERATKLSIAITAVSITEPASLVAIPGSIVSRAFTITNLAPTARTFGLTATSNPAWANLTGMPTSLALLAGQSTVVTINVAIPATATNGSFSTLTLTAVANDDPSVFDSASTVITAWNGPLLQSLNPPTVSVGSQFVLRGSGFGNDPGSGNRSTPLNNVTIAGRRVPDISVLAWADDAIIVRVPSSATTGLVYVVAGGQLSNPLELIVNNPIAIVIDVVSSYGLPKGIENSLISKLNNAKKALEAPNAIERQDAANHIRAFINEVAALRGKSLTTDQADTLSSWAQSILAGL